jgi:deazaflavin-dependent oxidoreductase (nitroreductase family)
VTGRTRMSWIRPFTNRVFNPLSRRFAGRLPGFGLLTYQGRASGREYHTPLNVFRRGDAFVFALTYGSASQWVKNVEAAGRATLETRGRSYVLVEPVRFRDPGQRLMPLPVRLILRLNAVDEFLRMRIER